MSLDLSTVPAFASRQHLGEYSTIAFNISNTYEMPVQLLTSHILQFQNVLDFAATLIQRQIDVTDQFTRESLFAQYLKDVNVAHALDVSRAEKKALSELSPLLQQISQIKLENSESVEALKHEYEQQIKALQKTNKTLESDASTVRSELEASQQKEVRALLKRVADLESDLQRASRGESAIREQCKVESDRLIKALDDKNKEILKVKEESLTQREQKLAERESDLQVKTKRQSSSVLRGQDGEHFFAKLAKDKMDWSLIKAPTHSCDYSSVILGAPVLFEVKNYSKPVPDKEVTKFIADMKMHPEALVGIFVSLNTGITGKVADVPITMDWIHGSQTIMYIQSCAELDIDHTLSLIEQVVRVSGMIGRALTSQEHESQEPVFQQRIEDTKVYVERSIANITKLITKIGVDKKNLTTLIEASSREHVSQLRHLMTDITTVSQTLLGIPIESVSEDTTESESKAKKKAPAKKKSP